MRGAASGAQLQPLSHHAHSSTSQRSLRRIRAVHSSQSACAPRLSPNWQNMKSGRLRL